jgi:lipoprotein signal peptidase
LHGCITTENKANADEHRLVSIFLIITGFLAFNTSLSGGKMLEVIHAFCFLFHIVPFGIAYGGGSEVYIALYYTVMWLVVAYAIYFLSLLIRPVKN